MTTNKLIETIKANISNFSNFDWICYAFTMAIMVVSFLLSIYNFILFLKSYKNPQDNPRRVYTAYLLIFLWGTVSITAGLVAICMVTGLSYSLLWVFHVFNFVILLNAFYNFLIDRRHYRQVL